MAHSAGRRRLSAIAASLATMTMSIGLAAIPAQAAPPPRADYVALGDSYTAGTGAGEAYRPNVACWQSHPNYADVVGSTGRISLVANAACHGAVLTTASQFYDGITPTVSEQLAALALSGQLSADTELVSITAGANDIGVTGVLLTCATSTVQACTDAVNAVTAALPLLEAALAQTYLSIQAAAPNATIAVLGYPLLFDPAGEPIIPLQNQLLINEATLRLNETIAAAVQTANDLGADAVYIDVTKRFAGHAVNSEDPWLVLDFRSPLPSYNFHPNATGYTFGYAPALISAVKPAQLARR